MEIIGIGTDIVECLRIRRMIERHGELFLIRVYTEREIRYCQSRRHATEHFAARWAAKEAVFKSLGTNWQKGMCWTDIEVVSEGTAGPRVAVCGASREIKQARGVTGFFLSLAHCRNYATAHAVAYRNGDY